MGSWKTMPMRSARILSSCRSAAPTISLPSKRMLPSIAALAGSRPMIASAVCVFPEPDSPTRPTDSPASTLNDNAETTSASA
jgi:hypothetical protein